MENKTIFALIGAVVLAVAAYVVLRSPEKGEHRNPVRPIAAFKATDVATLEIVDEKQEKTTMTRDGAEAWKITAPTAHPADAAGIKAVVTALEKLSFSDMVSEKKERAEEFGVTEGKAQRLTVKDAAGKTLADFFLGKSMAGFVMLRPAGTDQVWQSNNVFPYMVNRGPAGWRDHVVIEFPMNDATALTVESGADKLTVKKVEGADKKTEWVFGESAGRAPKAGETLDTQLVASTVQALASLRGNDFADDAKATEVGLEPAGLKLAITAGGKTYTLLVGNTKGEDTWVMTAGNPQIFTLKKFTTDRLHYAPADFRDKTLVKLKEAELAGIDVVMTGEKENVSLERAGEKFKRKGKGAAFDDTQTHALAGGFENLAGFGFADEKTIEKPMATVTLHPKTGAAIVLKIGAAREDFYPMQRGTGEVLKARKFAVERFLKKPAQLLPGANPPPPNPGQMAKKMGLPPQLPQAPHK
jgi:hypothetical protein